MSDCCTPQPAARQTTSSTSCPVTGTSGKRVKLITLKSLLAPEALATLDPDQSYFFCPIASCDVVYFSDTLIYSKDQVKVAIFQKETTPDVPACYCFGWTRSTLAEALMERDIDVPASITAHVRAGRCGCELNNPQGSCCLGNVRKALEELKLEKREVA